MKTAEKMPEVIQENNVIQVNASPLAAAERLLASGADLDKIEKMLELQERFEKNEAKKAYHQAMSEFKANPPTILKDRKVSFKNTRAICNSPCYFRERLSGHSCQRHSCPRCSQNSCTSCFRPVDID